MIIWKYLYVDNDVAIYWEIGRMQPQESIDIVNLNLI